MTLCGTKELKAFRLAALDGDIGQVKEVYFDEAQWVIRHLVVDTGHWLPGRRVLIPPQAVERLDPAQQRVQVRLTRAQVEQAPGIETDVPVSRQDEIDLYDHYRYPYYWAGSGLWGPMDSPLTGSVAPVAELDLASVRAHRAAARSTADSKLRSSADVIGHHVAARDGEIGHVDDFLFDRRSWQIRLVVIDTRNWLPDRLVLVSPESVKRIDWPTRRAVVGLSRAAVTASPPYTRGQALGSQRLH